MVALRNAVNVDLDNAGKPSLAPRLPQIAMTTGAHSGFDLRRRVLHGRPAAPKQLHDDDTVTDLGGLAGSHVAWAYANGHVYLSDGR